MKIPISKISRDGLSLDFEYTPGSLGVNSRDIIFEKNLHLYVYCTKISNALTVEIELSGEYKLICARCLDEKKVVLSHKNKLYFSLDDKQVFLDITEDIREEVMLNLPVKPLCKDDCKGICVNCGKNLNHEKCICKN